MASIKEQILREEKRLKAPVLTKQMVIDAVEKIKNTPEFKQRDDEFWAWLNVQSPGFQERFQKRLKERYSE